MIIQMEKTFRAMQCQKCRKYFKKKQESQNMVKKLDTNEEMITCNECR